MKLYESKNLFCDMLKNKAEQELFSFVYNKVKFDVLFLIDREPFEFLFGVIDVNYCFVLKMHKGFEIENISDEIFYKLCTILNLKPGKERFTSYMFLRYFAEKIPTVYSGTKIEPDMIAKYKNWYLDIDESEKIYFKGWRTHVSDGRKVRNLDKTKEILGDKAYEYCKKHNISSCWSHKKEERRPYFPPDKEQKYIGQ